MGRDPVDRQGPVVARARQTLAIDEDLGVLRTDPAQLGFVEFARVGGAGDARDPLKDIAHAQRLKPLKKLFSINQRRRHRIGAIAKIFG